MSKSMRPTDVALKMCGAKRRYLTAELANKALTRIRQRDPTTTLHSYRCPYCLWFHLGHPSKREQK